MPENNFADDLTKLIDETKGGKVQNETAMRIFEDAYKLLPGGGSVYQHDKQMVFENGVSAKYEIHRVPSGLYLESSLEVDQKGLDKCAIEKDEHKTMDCLRKEYGTPVSEARHTVFDTGEETNRSVERYRSVFWKNLVDGKTFGSSKLEFGDIALHKTEDGNSEKLTISKTNERGASEELTFTKPDTFYSAPVRYNGMRTVEPSGSVSAQRPMTRIIGNHGHQKTWF